MSKNKCQSHVSQDKVTARRWGNTKKYSDVLDKLHGGDAVQEGLMFMQELSLKTCFVNFDFFHLGYAGKRIHEQILYIVQCQ